MSLNAIIEGLQCGMTLAKPQGVTQRNTRGLAMWYVTRHVTGFHLYHD
jgi:hypothetical protein